MSEKQSWSRFIDNVMDKVLINKIINEEHPKGVYFVPYWSKWLLMITTGFCSISLLIGWVT